MEPATFIVLIALLGPAICLAASELVHALQHREQRVTRLRASIHTNRWHPAPTFGRRRVPGKSQSRRP